MASQHLSQHVDTICNIADTAPHCKIHMRRNSIAKLVRNALCIVRVAPDAFPAGAAGQHSQRLQGMIDSAAKAAEPALQRILAAHTATKDASGDNGNTQGVGGVVRSAHSDTAQQKLDAVNDGEDVDMQQPEEGGARVAEDDLENGAGHADGGAAHARQAHAQHSALQQAVSADEGPVAWYQALVQWLSRGAESAPLTTDFAMQGLHWALTLQRLQHPDLQSLVKEAPLLLRQKRCNLQEVPQRLEVYLSRLSDPAWQVRAECIAGLEPLWFRCGSTLCIFLAQRSTLGVSCVLRTQPLNSAILPSHILLC